MIEENHAELDALDATLLRLAACVNAIAASLPDPVPTQWGPSVVFRHTDTTAALAALLKTIKLVSTLNGAVVLLRSGYVQEVAALCRMADDFCTEILLLCASAEGGEDSELVKRFLDDFYSEETEDPEHLLTEHPVRINVSRSRIHAAVARAVSEHVNPSDGRAVLGVPQRVLSGYIHGAYPHIMELYGGPAQQFHMAGMAGTPRVAEWKKELVTYGYRAMMLSVCIAQKLGLNGIRAELASLRRDFEEQFQCDPKTGIAKQLRQIKKRR